MMHDLLAQADAAIDQFFAEGAEIRAAAKSGGARSNQAALVGSKRTMRALQQEIERCGIGVACIGLKFRVLNQIPDGMFVVIDLRKIGA